LARGPAAARQELAERLPDAPEVPAEVLDRLLADKDRRVQAAARAALPRLAARPRAPLRIIAMGGFAVRRGDSLIPAQAFGRERARALLAALLCAGRPVHREQLLEWFWPALPPDRGLRAFHVTLYELRRALEPELPRGAGSSVIVADGETYRIELAAQDGWDGAEFLGSADAALAERDPPLRLRRLEAAQASYGGILFPEWPYAPWSEARRAEVERVHREVLEQLAINLAAADQPQAAISRYRRLVELDPEREAWHRALMRLYAGIGERALALRQFHACRAVLRRELGIEPSGETRDLYQELLAQ
jgi:LuxR family maltose regulon positive regulatory protein